MTTKTTTKKCAGKGTKKQYTRQMSCSYCRRDVATQSAFSEVEGLILKSFDTEFGKRYAWFGME